MAAVALAITAGQGFGVVYFNDGNIHNVDYKILEQVEVGNDPTTNNPTALNLLQGSSTRLSVNNYDNSTTTLAGGSILGSLQLNDYASAQLLTGTISYQLMAYQNSTAVVDGGNIGEYIIVLNSANVEIFGGSIGSGIRVGQHSDNPIATFNAVTIYGRDFMVDGNPVEYGEFHSQLGGSLFKEPTRHVSGILSSGEELDTDFWVGQNGTILLIPEPATLLLLGLGAVMLRKRR